MTMKPMLACDADLDNLESLPYPRAALIKKDGVRVLIKESDAGVAGCFGRSLKLHRNPHVQHLFAKTEYLGFDAEGIVGPDNAGDVCSVTSGGFSRFRAKPGKPVEVDAVLHVFDLCDQPHLPFENRHAIAKIQIGILLRQNPGLPITLIDYTIVYNADELRAFEQDALDRGYEGVITRDLMGTYKHGRSTYKEGTYLRLKRFEEREAVVTRVDEGSVNGNAKKTNELGQSERSSHQENMTPNGMVGTIWATDLVDGIEKKIAPGRLTDAEAKHFFENQSEFVGQTIKYKFFPVGVKDKPRFPTFQCIRAAEDIS